MWPRVRGGSISGTARWRTIPPSTTTQGLQGVGALDSNSKQVKAIFGGTSGTVSVVVQGLSSQSYFGPSKVHATVWGVDSTVSSPNSGPYYVQEADYTESSGQITVSVPNTKATSAYYLIVTPAKSLSSVNSTTKYEAEYADLFGAATVSYGTNTGYSGTYFVQGYGTNSSAITEFDVAAATSGFYNIDLRYSSPNGSTNLDLYLNSALLETVSLSGTANANTWADKTVSVFLLAGINRIAYGALSDGTSNGVALDYINVTPGSGTITTYEASSSQNTLGGTAVAQTNSSAPGGTQVGYVGQGSANYLQFNNVNVPSAGLYRMTVNYANDEVYTDPEGGAVFRFAQISVNGGAATQVYFDNAFSWNTFESIEINVQLNAGNNTIRFSNDTTSPTPNLDSGWVPVIATIQIAGSE